MGFVYICPADLFLNSPPLVPSTSPLPPLSFFFCFQPNPLVWFDGNMFLSAIVFAHLSPPPSSWQPRLFFGNLSSNEIFLKFSSNLISYQKNYEVVDRSKIVKKKKIKRIINSPREMNWLLLRLQIYRRLFDFIFSFNLPPPPLPLFKKE